MYSSTRFKVFLWFSVTSTFLLASSLTIDYYLVKHEIVLQSQGSHIKRLQSGSIDVVKNMRLAILAFERFISAPHDDHASSPDYLELAEAGFLQHELIDLEAPCLRSVPEIAARQNSGAINCPVYPPLEGVGNTSLPTWRFHGESGKLAYIPKRLGSEQAKQFPILIVDAAQLLSPLLVTLESHSGEQVLATPLVEIRKNNGETLLFNQANEIVQLPETDNTAHPAIVLQPSGIFSDPTLNAIVRFGEEPLYATLKITAFPVLKEIELVKRDTALVSLLGFALLCFLAIQAGGRFARPLVDLAEEAKKIARGERSFSAPKNRQMSREMEELSHSFGVMVENLKLREKQIADNVTKSARINTELEVARNIQKQMLPNRSLFADAQTGYSAHADMLPARETSGDFFEAFPISEHKTGFVVADVSDKGVPAALLAATAKILLRLVARGKNPDPAKCLEEVNNFLLDEFKTNQFLTAFYGILDRRDHVFHFSLAGHYPPILLHEGRAVPVDADTGIGLSMFPKVKYVSHKIQIQPSDTVLVYTDGLVEAENADGEAFGEARVLDLLEYGGTAEEIVMGLFAELKNFEGAARFDDATLMAVKRDL